MRSLAPHALGLIGYPIHSAMFATLRRVQFEEDDASFVITDIIEVVNGIGPFDEQYVHLTCRYYNRPSNPDGRGVAEHTVYGAHEFLSSANPEGYASGIDYYYANNGYVVVDGGPRGVA